MTENAVKPIKTFVSYSWSSPTHESWVVSLATRLREDGVDVVLDKWDLRPGDDAIAFMERMVTDPQVRKVLIICDRKYCLKADAREGGVGTECQIISPELYGRAKQDKFSALITELNDDGTGAVPTFYRGRIYFNFSSDEKYETEYDALLRWIIDKPLRTKPPLGSIPTQFLAAAPSVPSTESAFRRVEDAVRKNSPTAAGLIREFSDAVGRGLESLRLTGSGGDRDFDDWVIAGIEAARPYVSQVHGLASALSRFTADGNAVIAFTRLLEKIGKFMFRTENMNSWGNWDFDNFKYIAHEMFLGSLAVFLREERFDLASHLIAHPYYLDQDTFIHSATISYAAFSSDVESLQARNQRLKLGKYSLHADLLKQEYENRVPNFVDLMQADFLLYIRDRLDEDGRVRWRPVTLVYAGSRNRPFEIFARSESRLYFARVIPMLKNVSADQFKELIAKIPSPERLSVFGRSGYSVSVLANWANIGTID